MRRRAVFWVLFVGLCAASLSAQQNSTLNTSLTSLKIFREDIRRHALPILVMFRQLEASVGQTASQYAKIVKLSAEIHENDLAESPVIFTAPMNAEFPILETRDEWWRIRLNDGREGWVNDAHFQVITARDISNSAYQQELAGIIELAGEWRLEINAKRDSATQVFNQANQYYSGLPMAQQEQLKSEFTELSTLLSQAKRYAGYVNHYYYKYLAFYRPPASKSSIFDNTSGMLTVQLGTSSYESGGEKSTTSRNIIFTGRKVLNDRSELNASINSRKEIIQTPYSSNNYRLAYRYAVPNGLRVASYLGVNTFADDSLSRNSFNQWNAGYNLNYPLKPAMDVYHDFNFSQKNLEDDGANGYSNGLFNAGLRFRPDSQTLWTFSTRGLIQSSDAAFLEFNRYVPQILYRRQKLDGVFQGLLNMEFLGYNEDAEQNNYQRERLELSWQRPGSTRRLMVIGKQYPNNETLNYLKLGGQLQWQKNRTASFSRTNMSLLLAYFPEMKEQDGHYLDFRMDQSRTFSRYFLDFNVFARVWSEPNGVVRRYHMVDFYQSFGMSWGRFRIGPLIGAHLLMHPDEKLFEKDGNSLRTGVDFKGNFIIKKAMLNFSMQYEYDFLFGEEYVINPNTGEITTGDVVTRNPTTLNLMIDFRVPVTRNFDFQALVTKYKINLDFDDDAADALNTSRDRMTLLAGLVYRFNR